MHKGAFEFIQKFSTNDPISVIEIGSRNINGTVRTHFPNAIWTGLDLHPGPMVDVVVDASEYNSSEPVDMVVCCEVFEHCERWIDVLRNAHNWLKPSGMLLITCAGPGREPHSAVDGGKLRAGEFYANLSQDQMCDELIQIGFDIVESMVNSQWKDTYAACRRI